jgi:hypothetical protein
MRAVAISKKHNSLSLARDKGKFLEEMERHYDILVMNLHQLNEMPTTI